MKINFVGDIMLGRLVNEFLKNKSPEYPWGDTLSILKTQGLRICNLECVISNIGAPWSITPKVFHFRTDPKNVEVLKVAGIDPVSIANNHALDFEYEALSQMMKILGENGINFAGAGSNLLEAQEPAICEIKGEKVGFIAFTDNEPDWEAQENRPGIFYVPIDLNDWRAKKLLELIKKTKSLVNLLIVSAHWGPNWGYDPPQSHISFAHKLINAGADIIFGHSGHIVRGVELYKNRAIIYCAGNFIDDYAVDEVERNDRSFIFILETKSHRVVKIILYPTVIVRFQSRLAKGYEQEEIVLKMQELCYKLGTKTQWRKNMGYLEVLL